MENASFPACGAHTNQDSQDISDGVIHVRAEKVNNPLMCKVSMFLPNNTPTSKLLLCLRVQCPTIFVTF